MRSPGGKKERLMHLYGSTASPFVQRVLMTVRAKGHEIELRLPPGEGGLRSAAFRAISPMGRIPLLELDDGETLCESDAIAAYLDETLTGPPLLAGTALERARTREIMALTALEVASGLRPIMLHLVFRIGDAPDVVAAARHQMEGGLDAIARLLDPVGPWALGDAIGAADCMLVPILTLAQIAGPPAGTWALVTARPRVAAYWDRIVGNPVARRSIDEMEAGFAGMLRRNAAPAAG